MEASGHGQTYLLRTDTWPALPALARVTLPGKQETPSMSQPSWASAILLSLYACDLGFSRQQPWEAGRGNWGQERLKDLLKDGGNQSLQSFVSAGYKTVDPGVISFRVLWPPSPLLSDPQLWGWHLPHSLLLWTKCFCPPQNSYVESLTPNEMVLGNEDSGRWLGLGGFMRVEPPQWP